MANQVHLSILKQGVDVWNEWRAKNLMFRVDLRGIELNGANLDEVDLRGADLGASYRLGQGFSATRSNLRKTSLRGANLTEVNAKDANLDQADLTGAFLRGARLTGTYLNKVKLIGADLSSANLMGANLREANLRGADLSATDLRGAELTAADLREADLRSANLSSASLAAANLRGCNMGGTILRNLNLRRVIGLDDVYHSAPSYISNEVFVYSGGELSPAFLRGCGLTDWEIEAIKLHNPRLRNEEVNEILYRMYDERATKALQISPLFISYSHLDSEFVDKIGVCLMELGIRYWQDTHELKAGRLEKQIDRAIRQNPTVLLVLSKHALSSVWVEHEVRTAKELEQEFGRDILCPVALDDSWKSSRWPKRVIEQIMEYNILNFSEWEDDSKFLAIFYKLIEGLGLFYRG